MLQEKVFFTPALLQATPYRSEARMNFLDKCRCMSLCLKLHHCCIIILCNTDPLCHYRYHLKRKQAFFTKVKKQRM